MPTKNRVKIYVPEAYYHIYNRGVNKRKIFLDEQDYSVFLSLLKRYLSNNRSPNKYGETYEDLSDEIILLAYCLMPNHVHLLVFQINVSGMTNLMRRVFTSYSMYFNKKYKRVGNLFQDAYKARLVESDGYLHHISRYVHLNPDNWRKYAYSSIGYYVGSKKTDWLKTEPILDLFKNKKEYSNFLSDYEDYKRSLDAVKHLLANH